ncbi:hypothetical protein [Pseudorhodoplanes sp.]|uniref:hypothetical protein n=1 Tax=Pseudorhodoplanes sp. TaxID=1934341 RepID=UPI003D0A8148
MVTADTAVAVVTAVIVIMAKITVIMEEGATAITAGVTMAGVITVTVAGIMAVIGMAARAGSPAALTT